MTIDFDEKGKIFTNIIPKDIVYGWIQTTHHYIEGEIHIRRDTRLKDELDIDEQFLAVTNAKVFNIEHVLVFKTRFMAIRREQIIWVTTFDDVEEGKNQ